MVVLRAHDIAPSGQISSLLGHFPVADALPAWERELDLLHARPLPIGVPVRRVHYNSQP